MLDLTKPLRHKKTKAEARVIFEDPRCTERGLGYLVVVYRGSMWKGMQFEGSCDTCTASPAWISRDELERHLENVPTKITGEVWVNVYEDGSCLPHDKRFSADNAASPRRIARIKLPFTAEEGQFDE